MVEEEIGPTVPAAGRLPGWRPMNTIESLPAVDPERISPPCFSEHSAQVLVTIPESGITHIVWVSRRPHRLNRATGKWSCACEFGYTVSLSTMLWRAAKFPANYKTPQDYRRSICECYQPIWLE